MESPSAIAQAPAFVGPTFPGCCSRHGDPAGDSVQLTQFPAFRVDLITISGIEVPLSRFAFTQGLGNYVRRELECAQKRPVSDRKSPTSEVTVTVSPSFVCRVHITHPCTYGAQCKFAHVCPEVCQTVLVRALQQQLPASVRDSFREAVAARSLPHSPSFSHGVSAVTSLAASGSSVDIVSRRASSNVNQPVYGHGGGSYGAGETAIVPGGLLTHYAGGGAPAPSHSYHAPLVPVPQQSTGQLPHVVHLQPSQAHLPLQPQGHMVFGGGLQHPGAQSMTYHQGPHPGFARLMQPYDPTSGAVMQPHSAMPVTSLHSSPQLSFAMNARGEVGYGPQSVMMQPLQLPMHPGSLVSSPHQPSPMSYVYADPNSPTQPLFAYAPQGQPVPPGSQQQQLPLPVPPPAPSYYVVMGHPPPH